MMKKSWVDIEIKEKGQIKDGQHLSVNLALKSYQKNQSKEAQNFDENSYAELKDQAYRTVDLLISNPTVTDAHFEILKTQINSGHMLFSEDDKRDWVACVKKIWDEPLLADGFQSHPALKKYVEYLETLPERAESLRSGLVPEDVLDIKSLKR